jgi:mannose-6-phosphate isomerase-like protein (cupin superfamily)
LAKVPAGSILARMNTSAINFQDKFARFHEPWKPKVIAEMNDYQFKLVRLIGEFVWHHHADTDEVFIVIEGEMVLRFRDHAVPLRAGELYVVPKGVEHQPFAAQECKVLLVEPKGVVNTGTTGGSLTAPDDVWI